MEQNSLFFLAAFAILVVLGILLFGIGGFATGSAFNRKHANKIMRWRIMAQAMAVALMLVVAFVYRD
ncbi:MAG: HIG1 domain-containing protein [Rhodobacteraceae bacterium]|nr:HIG1 domain-containing protein [Paracoccaceae bacterium]